MDNKLFKEKIKYGTVPNVLLLGNGINIPFSDNKNTSDLIKTIWCDNHKEKSPPKELYNLPFPMQIIAAGNDNVKNCMHKLAEQFQNPTVPEEQKNLILGYLSIGFDAVLTTNYSLEIEKSTLPDFSVRNVQNNFRYTKRKLTEKERNSLLYTCVELGDENNSHLWHIHGISTRTDSMVMSHYYYGKLLSEIFEKAADTIRYYKFSNTKKLDYNVSSWVDYFLMGNIHIFGFGLDLSEMDLWWLLGCKKQHFPNTKVYFYNLTPVKPEMRLIFDAYNIEIITDMKFENKDYISYYNRLQNTINENINKKEKKK